MSLQLAQWVLFKKPHVAQLVLFVKAHPAGCTFTEIIEGGHSLRLAKKLAREESLIFESGGVFYPVTAAR